MVRKDDRETNLRKSERKKMSELVDFSNASILATVITARHEVLVAIEHENNPQNGKYRYNPDDYKDTKRIYQAMVKYYKAYEKYIEEPTTENRIYLDAESINLYFDIKHEDLDWTTRVAMWHYFGGDGINSTTYVNPHKNVSLDEWKKEFEKYKTKMSKYGITITFAHNYYPYEPLFHVSFSDPKPLSETNNIYLENEGVELVEKAIILGIRPKYSVNRFLQLRDKKKMKNTQEIHTV